MRPTYEPDAVNAEDAMAKFNREDLRRCEPTTNVLVEVEQRAADPLGLVRGELFLPVHVQRPLCCLETDSSEQKERGQARWSGVFGDEWARSALPPREGRQDSRVVRGPV